MRKLYFLLIAMVASFAANAALYITGDLTQSNWNPGNPVEMTLSDSSYSYSGVVTKFKISTTKGTWDEFNAGALCASNLKNGVAANLVKGSSDILVPFSEDVNGNPVTWTIKVNSDCTQITLTTNQTPTPNFPKAYIRGDMNGWNSSPAWELKTTDGVTYTLDSVTIAANQKFKIADDNWGTINYGGGAGINTDTIYELYYNGDNCSLKVDVENIKVTFTLKGNNKATLLFGEASTPEPTFPKAYIRGDMNDWNPSPAWELKTTDGVTYTLDSVTIAANQKFKIADDNWGTINYGGGAGINTDTIYELYYNGDNCSLKVDVENIKVTFTLKGDNKATLLFGEASTPEPLPVLYLRGSMNDWQADDAWKFVESDSIYMLENVTINKGAEFKIADTNWNADFGGNSESAVSITPNDNDATVLVERGNNLILSASVTNATVIFDYTTKALSINGTIFKDTVPVPTDLYLIGSIKNVDWTPDKALAMTYNSDDKTFKAKEVVFVGNPAYFSFTTVLNSDWTIINSNNRYGAANNGANILLGEEYGVVCKKGDIGAFSIVPVEGATYDVTVDFSDATAPFVKVTQGSQSSVNDIEANDEVVNVYNLQGIAVRKGVKASDAAAELPAGLYIIGNKKVIVK